MFRYDLAQFAGLERSRFIHALNAEGVPCSGGYTPLNKEPFMQATLSSRAFKRIYSEKELKGYVERNHCPENDELCKEAVWFDQTMLLGSQDDMEQIVAAVRKIHAQAADVVRA
jgi:dTDP-4-amino-4,6-dideoxygalactose transaminase